MDLLAELDPGPEPEDLLELGDEGDVGAPVELVRRSNALSWITLAGFTVATWGLFQRAGWWEDTALASAAVGALAMIPYWIAADHAGETSPAFNVVIHLAGSIGVAVLLLQPSLHRWVESHVVG